jgi:G3E family GTPase
MEVLRRLLITEQHDFDGIIIETTGLADPAPIAQTFFVEPDISERCSLDAIITVVDAKHVMQHLDEVRPEGVENETLEQIAFADKLLISKCDLVDKDHIEKVTSRIRSINSTAEIVQVTNGEIDPS